MHEAHRSKHVRIVNWHWIPMVIIAVIGLLSPICSRFKRPTDRRRVPWPREAHGPSAASNEPDRRVQTCSCDSDGKLANTPNRLERCEICRYSIRKTLNRLIWRDRITRTIVVPSRADTLTCKEKRDVELAAVVDRFKHWLGCCRERTEAADDMAQSLRRIVDMDSFALLQEKLENWLDDYDVSKLSLPPLYARHVRLYRGLLFAIQYVCGSTGMLHSKLSYIRKIVYLY